MLAFAAGAGAASLQSIGTFKAPIYVTSDPGKPNALYVVEREGQIVVSEDGAVREFADLRSVVGCCGGETGLLSVALAPDFDTSGRLFVDYTDAGGEIHVAELRAAGTTAPLSSLRPLLAIPHPTYTNHYGGQLQFGPEGLLYISTGDGGGANDPGGNAQSLSSLLGKILRIDPNPSALAPYTIPPGNPFASLPAPYSTIFSYGLRNPFRFSFDRLTHDLVIADVGEAAREEIDLAPAPGLGAGADYGWNCFEGKVPGTAPEPGCKTPPAGGYTSPAFEYAHEVGADAIIGGYVVRDPSLGESLYGRYLYGDFGNGGLRSLSLAEPFTSDRSEGLTVSELSSFGEDSCGRVYVVAGSGAVSRVVGTTANTCTAPVAAVPLAPSGVGIKAVTRRVRHNGRAQITAWVSPCAGRRGEPIQLWQGQRKIGVHRLDRACTARFLPRVRHRVKFRAAVPADATYVAASSRALGFHVFHPKKERKGAEGGRLHIPPGVGHR
jgi:glucose/arabinose dehydrogenase